MPNDDQITTAQDQSVLGRAIQERFPRYYKYFSTEQFVYHGHAMRNHNHLLGVVGGVDGIKTGYTHASGFNLVTSVHRDGRYIVAVVLGGRSAGERDAHMRELINSPSEKHRCGARPRPSPKEWKPAPSPESRTASAPNSARRSRSSLRRRHHCRRAPTRRRQARPMGTAVAGDPIQPLLVKTITYRTAPVQAAPLAPMPALVAAAPLPRPQRCRFRRFPLRPAGGACGSTADTDGVASRGDCSVAAASNREPSDAGSCVSARGDTIDADGVTGTSADSGGCNDRGSGCTNARGRSNNTVVVASTEPAVIAPSTKMQTPGRSVIAKSDSARSEAPRSEAARPEAPKSEAAKPETAKLETAKLETAKLEVVKSDPAEPEAAKTEIVKPEPSAAQIRARGGWVIQIGAFEGEEEAKQHLSEARLKIPHILASADPFTERVQKGEKVLYRARFAGFDKANAEAACKQLKRSDIACMTVKN